MVKYLVTFYKKDVDGLVYTKDFWYESFDDAIKFVKESTAVNWSIKKLNVIDKGGNDEK